MVIFSILYSVRGIGFWIAKWISMILGIINGLLHSRIKVLHSENIISGQLNHMQLYCRCVIGSLKSFSYKINCMPI